MTGTGEASSATANPAARDPRRPRLDQPLCVDRRSGAAHPLKRFVIDGEAVVLGIDGISDFSALHSGKRNERCSSAPSTCPLFKL